MVKLPQSGNIFFTLIAVDGIDKMRRVLWLALYAIISIPTISTMSLGCQIDQQAAELSIGITDHFSCLYQAGIRADVGIMVYIQNVENAIAQTDIHTGVITATRGAIGSDNDFF